MCALGGAFSGLLFPNSPLNTIRTVMTPTTTATIIGKDNSNIVAIHSPAIKERLPTERQKLPDEDKKEPENNVNSAAGL